MENKEYQLKLELEYPKLVWPPDVDMGTYLYFDCELRKRQDPEIVSDRMFEKMRQSLGFLTKKFSAVSNSGSIETVVKNDVDQLEFET